jgi:hypothetical protein
LERMCTRMRASLLVSERRKNDATHPCRHVVVVVVAADDADGAAGAAGAAGAGAGAVVVVAAGAVAAVAAVDIVVVFGTAVSHAVETRVVKPAVASLDRVEPHPPRAAAMKSGCAVVKSSEAEPLGCVRTVWSPWCADWVSELM